MYYDADGYIFTLSEILCDINIPIRLTYKSMAKLSGAPGCSKADMINANPQLKLTKVFISLIKTFFKSSFLS